MNSPLKLGPLLFCVLASGLPAAAVTVNDGSTTTNLIQISNSSPDSQDTAEAHLDVTSAVLQASQSGDSGFFAFRSAWYASDLVATGGVYTVTADFNPSATDPDIRYTRRGGVMGWLNLVSSNGIALQVIPDDPASGFSVTNFRVSVIDFSAGDGNLNDSLANLYNLNGTPASVVTAPAVTAAPANFSVTNFATFQLAFAAPSAADQTALTNRATAHITGKVLQASTSGGVPVQVGPAIELLTTLPLPEAATHRFGYFAYWGSASDPGGIIGYLDNLTAQGAVGSAPNLPPDVTISEPADGAVFVAPASIDITASAMDLDGAVTHVDFYAGAALLGTATNNPFQVTWSNVAAGNYALTALATDDRGATSTSNPVNVTVTGSTSGSPTLMIVLADNAIVISWPSSGFQLQSRPDLSTANWTDLSTNTLSLTQVTLPITPGNQFFRLKQPGPLASPALSILSSGGSVTLSWPAQVSGYVLESNTNLSSTNWVTVSAPGNQAVEPVGSLPKFYRLRGQ